VISCIAVAAPAYPAFAETPEVECNRLMGQIGQKAPAEAHDALQRMRVYRDANQYTACVEAGRTAQSGSAAPSSFPAAHVADMEIVGEGNIEIGDVDRLARDGDGQVYAIVTFRGPRWPGNKQVALRLDSMVFAAGKLQVKVGTEELRRIPSVHQDGRTYADLGGSETVELHVSAPTGTGSTAGGNKAQ
jgi:hypothetical protein